LVSRTAHILVAGAGVFGSAIALELARRGMAVTLADPAPVGDNASGVAAGMLAPAFEALLDEASAGHFPFLLEARDLWPGFIDEAAVGLRRSGAAWLALDDDPPDAAMSLFTRLRALGAPAEAWSARVAADRLPGLGPRVGAGVFTPADWRLSAPEALGALRAAAQDAGATIVRAEVASFVRGRARLAGGGELAADILVVATGATGARLAPELAVLSPIKGHILRYAAQADGGPMLRCRLGYASGGPDGLMVGATMEAGRADRTIDPVQVEGLRVLAATLRPALADAPMTAAAGVRAASPDGLPLVGPSAAPGVFVAAGARRNGWLMAPLVARLTGAYLAKGEPGPHADLLDPRRFAGK
jgi:glycine oxidase